MWQLCALSDDIYVRRAGKSPPRQPDVQCSLHGAGACPADKVPGSSQVALGGIELIGFSGSPIPEPLYSSKQDAVAGRLRWQNQGRFRPERSQEVHRRQSRGFENNSAGCGRIGRTCRLFSTAFLLSLNPLGRRPTSSRLHTDFGIWFAEVISRHHIDLSDHAKLHDRITLSRAKYPYQPPCHHARIVRLEQMWRETKTDRNLEEKRC